MAKEPIGSALSIHDPRKVGPWSVNSRLGAGGMGVVYHATSGGRQAAVKVIRPGLLDAPATRERFSREVAILRSVRDVHISQFLAADLDTEPAWLAIEYISGPVLREQVAQHGPLAATQWWELARGLAQALAVLEVHRVTHRDIKPANVILNERGPVLIDFGIAHPEDATSLTATGLVTGSPAWLSPEQANLEPTGPASDVFCLGSLLAFAATGRPPFGEGASVAVLVSIATRPPDLAGVDEERAELLTRMMAKDPAERPTARDVLRETRGRAESAARAPGAPAAPVASSTTPEPVGTPPPGAGDTTPIEPVARTATRPADAADTRVAGSDATLISPAPAAAPGSSSSPAPPAAPATSAPLAPPPARPARSGRTTRPRATPERSGRARALVMLLVVAAVAVLGWVAVSSLTDGGTGPGGSTAPDTSDAPPAPSSDSLRDGQWLLASYRLNNADGAMSIAGTVQNVGDATASADLRVWIYAGGDPLGSVTAAVTDVPGGTSVDVTMTGDAIWRAGQKVVLLQAS